MAGGVVSDLVGEECSHVFDPGNIDQEFRQVEGFLGRGLGAVDKRRGAVTGGDTFVLFADRTDARTGGGDHIVDAGVGERLDVALNLADGFLLITGIHVHLPATCLLLGVDHIVAKSREEQCRGFGRIGEHRVTDAGGKERNFHQIEAPGKGEFVS